MNALTSGSFPNGLPEIGSEASARANRNEMLSIIQAGVKAAVECDPKVQPQNCMHCGSEADAGRCGITTRFAVTCSNDDCPVEQQATAGSLQEAIALWNRRAV